MGDTLLYLYFTMWDCTLVKLYFMLFCMFYNILQVTELGHFSPCIVKKRNFCDCKEDQQSEMQLVH